jgi:protocatechuate 3,4-dioxygenase beta subunit
MADFIVDEEDIDENGQPVRYILLYVWMSKRCI